MVGSTYVGLIECLSRVMGNYHALFFEEGSAVMSASYSTTKKLTGRAGNLDGSRVVPRMESSSGNIFCKWWLMAAPVSSLFISRRDFNRNTNASNPKTINTEILCLILFGRLGSGIRDNFWNNVGNTLLQILICSPRISWRTSCSSSIVWYGRFALIAWVRWIILLPVALIFSSAAHDK